jgi:hypothetical protein
MKNRPSISSRVFVPDGLKAKDGCAGGMSRTGISQAHRAAGFGFRNVSVTALRAPFRNSSARFILEIERLFRTHKTQPQRAKPDPEKIG